MCHVSCLILTSTVHVQAASQRAEDGSEAGAADGDKDRERKISKYKVKETKTNSYKAKGKRYTPSAFK